MNVKVNIDNVKECWGYYETYMEEYRKTHYSDDTNYDEFVDWCYENLYQCPNCDCIVLKDDQTRMYDPFNSDNVCDDCIENGGYYE